MNLKGAVTRFGLNKFIDFGEKHVDTICLFDTGIGSLNVGDEIINSSAREQLNRVFSSKQFLRVSTHNRISSKGIYNANYSENRIVCGSNLMRSNLFRSGNWDMNICDAFRLNPIITLGVGWYKYDNSIEYFTKHIYKNLLSEDHIHSVRDSYTESVFKNKIGMSNVVNTGCPTMWKFTPEFCQNIARYKSNAAVFTLTDYDQDVINDTQMIKTILRLYDDVYFWIQGSGDYKYFSSLEVDKNRITIVPPQLSSYDKLLSELDIDFIGTRLHGGIRAMQYFRRSLIVAIDNRAREKSVDFNIPIIEREDVVNNLEQKLLGDFDSEIKIPQEQISEWLSQFK